MEIVKIHGYQGKDPIENLELIKECILDLQCGALTEGAALTIIASIVDPVGITQEDMKWAEESYQKYLNK